MSLSPSRPIPVRPEIAALRAYRLAQSAPVKLNQNESPEDWPDAFKDEVLRSVAARPWNRYPPVDGADLRRALAASAGVGPEMVAVTNGSNEAILALVQTFASGRAVVVTAPGYSMSTPLALVGGARVRAVLLREDLSLDVAAMCTAALEPDAALAFIASPNNPTGNAFAGEALQAVIGASPGIVVIDEAYADFTPTSMIRALASYPNLVVLRTFSKAFALAGVRLGWIAAREEIVAAVRKALPPYNVGVFAQEAALAALRRPELVRARAAAIIAERERVAAALGQLPGVIRYPSQTNFILFHTPRPADEVYQGLLARGVLIRDVSAQPRLEGCLRVTIGRSDENDAFLAALREVLA